MSEVDVKEKVMKAIRDLGCDVKEILPVHNLQLDLGIDSTELIELAELVKTECGLQARTLNLKNIQTVDEMICQLEEAIA